MQRACGGDRGRRVADMAEGEEVDVLMTLEALPYECLVECLTHIETAETLCALREVSQTLCEAAGADVLWRALCVKHQHGQSLDFRQALGSFGHPDAKPLTDRATSSDHGGLVWRDIFRKSRDALQTTICIDTGRGYAKYGLASSARPQMIQICQPGAEASQESLYHLAFRRLGLGRVDMSTHAAIISEPFRLASAAAERERAVWRYETELRILRGFQLKQVCIVDSASLCLFAHNLTSGVVVNIGFGTTFIVPVLRGHVIRDAVRVLRVGGATLSNFFAEILQVRGHDISWRPELGGERIAEITVARNLKERGAEVYPSSLAELCHSSTGNLAITELFKLPEPSIEPVTMGEVTFEVRIPVTTHRYPSPYARAAIACASPMLTGDGSLRHVCAAWLGALYPRGALLSTRAARWQFARPAHPLLYRQDGRARSVG